jgi:hypothetical protein
MPADQFTVTTHTSWFTRIKQAFGGIVIGLLLIPGSMWLLAWNEGRAVTTARSLAEGAGIVRSVDIARPDPANEGRLVHVAGPLRVPGTLRDPEFGVTAEGAVRLVRTVEMYQWEEERRSETRTTLGGGQETVTTYSYRQSWSSRPIDSGRFQQPQGRQNPPFRYQAATQAAREGTIGGFRLAEAQLSGIGESRPVPLQQGQVTVPPGAQIQGDAIYVSAQGFGAPGGAAQIGDMRIRFQVARAEEATVLAGQRGDAFAPYQTRAGDVLMMTATGVVPAAEMIRQAEQTNMLMTWGIRLGGALLMMIGFGMILAPFRVLADVVPLFGAIVGAGTGLIGLMLTAILAPLTIAIAWFAYRPLVGAIVFAAGVAVAVGVGWIAKNRRRPAAAPAAG